MLKELRRKFEGFCFRNRSKGIPNLMLYLVIGSGLVYLFYMVTGNAVLYSVLCFDRDAILHGQVWRLFSYAITYASNNILLEVIGLICYFSLGRAMENVWGTLKFNLFYLTGIVLMDIFGLLFNCRADIYFLNLSLFLSYATLYPDARFLFLFIIPVRAWIFAILDLVLILFDVCTMPFPQNLFPIVALLNYFLFFGKDVVNVIPLSWRSGISKKVGKKPKVATGTIPFRRDTPPKPDYTHRCTVCGRTDISDPQLEFRYCSRCKGYYCYCQDHISNHTHIE